MIQDIEDERENRTEKKAGRQREIDRRSSAFPGNIPGQAAQRESQLFCEQNADAQKDNGDSGVDQQTSHSLHVFQCRPGLDSFAEGVTFTEIAIGFRLLPVATPEEQAWS
jgi:hypothetical protein